MSIVACVKVYDGIVIGAESMSQLLVQTAPGQPQFVKAYSNARKLFRVADLPFGVLAYGAGNIKTRSVQSFLYEFNEQICADTQNQREKLTAEAIANRLFQFISVPYAEAFGQIPVPQQPVLGFYLAGYSPGQHLGTEWEFVLPSSDKPLQPRGDDQFGASWRGVALPFARLHFGIDPRFIGMLTAEGVSAEVIEKIQNVAKLLQSPVAFDGMPLQDAIGFCRFILETTINQSTYELGVPSCGGPLHVAIITRGNKFDWIAEPEYSL